MNQIIPENNTQIVYFSHGGGPLPILGDPGHRAMIDFMIQLPDQLKKPELILVISAHWEENAATLLGAHHPPMFYDYYGFPEQAYEITYPAPGSPQFAGKVAALLEENNIRAAIDPRRGFDHGLFIPLKFNVPAGGYPLLTALASARIGSSCAYFPGTRPAGIETGKPAGDRLRILLP